MEEIDLGNGLKVKAEFLNNGENMAEEYFDFNKYKTDWHEYRRNCYHLTVILQCPRRSYRNVMEDYVASLESRGSWFMGDILHIEAMEHKISRDGYYVKEFPLDVILEFDINHENFDMIISSEDEVIHLVGKIDLLHTIERRVEDIKTYMEWFLPKNVKDVELNYIRQVILYTFIINHTYMVKEPIEEVYIVCVSKKNAYTKVLRIEYDENVGLELYKWIIERTKKFHTYIIEGTMPEAEPNKFCQYGEYIEECPEAREFLKDILEPINNESRLFKQAYPEKKAYYKRDEKWNETKLFIAFKAQLKKIEQNKQKETTN